MPTLRGGRTAAVLALYRRSTFCVHPPGDTLARGAIIDSMGAGCIPVLLHAAQRRLWPLHWNGSSGSSVLDDWSGGELRPAAHVEASAYANRAAALLHSLLVMPDDAVRALQREVRRAVPRLLYRRRRKDTSREAQEDAVDVLVGALRKLRRVPTAEEVRAQRAQLARMDAAVAHERTVRGCRAVNGKIDVRAVLTRKSGQRGPCFYWA